MTDIYSEATRIRKAETPQSEQIPGRTDMVKNSEGAYVFAVDDWKRLRRFLVLGSDGGTYYVTPQKLTQENAAAVARCLKANGKRTVDEIVSISSSGAAPHNDPALLALAMAASPQFADSKTVKLALEALPQVARIGTHLLRFAGYVEGFRGWGRGLRHAVARWFLDRPAEQLALQAVKYAQREGWALKDLLRLAHPTTKRTDWMSVLQYIAHPEDAVSLKPGMAVIDVRERGSAGVREGKPRFIQLPQIIEGALLAREPGADVAAIVAKYRLPFEALQTEALNNPEVWEALLYVPMTITTMIRSLGKMTAVGLLKPLSRESLYVANHLVDQEKLRVARVHPLALLIAMKVYSQDYGQKGSLTWKHDPSIVKALDDAFYLAFQNVAPAGVGHYLGIDVSSSMSWSLINNTALKASEGAAAMAMVQVATEPSVYAAAFATEMKELPLHANMSLKEVVRKTSNITFGGTDCSKPMLDALERKIEARVFVVYTDSETWAGRIHPVQALKKYRDKMGIPARLVVVGMTSNGFTIADPDDAGMLDVVGFDAGAPAMIADFAGGR